MPVNMEQVGQNESQIHSELPLAVLVYIAGQPSDVSYKHNVVYVQTLTVHNPQYTLNDTRSDEK
jgi:hypothetical protein